MENGGIVHIGAEQIREANCYFTFFMAFQFENFKEKKEIKLTLLFIFPHTEYVYR